MIVVENTSWCQPVFVCDHDSECYPPARIAEGSVTLIHFTLLSMLAEANPECLHHTGTELLPTHKVA